MISFQITFSTMSFQLFSSKRFKWWFDEHYFSNNAQKFNNFTVPWMNFFLTKNGNSLKPQEIVSPFQVDMLPRSTCGALMMRKMISAVKIHTFAARFRRSAAAIWSNCLEISRTVVFLVNFHAVIWEECIKQSFKPWIQFGSWDIFIGFSTPSLSQPSSECKWHVKFYTQNDHHPNWWLEYNRHDLGVETPGKQSPRCRMTVTVVSFWIGNPEKKKKTFKIATIASCGGRSQLWSILEFQVAQISSARAIHLIQAWQGGWRCNMKVLEKKSSQTSQELFCFILFEGLKF